MRERLALALALGLLAPCGCAELPRNAVSLAVDRPPATSPWPRLFPRPSREQRLAAPPPSTKPHSGSSTPAVTAEHEAALERLDPETRRLLDSELERLPTEAERIRLLTYLSTVPTDRIRALLLTPRRDTQTNAESSPSLVHPMADVERLLGAPEQRDSGLHLMAHAPREVVQESAYSAVAGPEGTFQAGPAIPPPEPPPAAGPGDPAAESAAPSPPSAFSKLKQWDPRKSWGLGWTSTTPSPEVPETRETTSPETLLSPLARITGRKVRGEQGGPGVPDSDLPPPKSRTSNSTDLDATYFQEELQRLLSLMEAKAERLEPGSTFGTRDAYIRQQVMLRLLYLMNNEPQLAQQAIPGIDQPTQEFWTSMMWGLSSYFDTETTPDPSDRAALTLQQLRSAIEHLQPTARLEVRGLTFCERIDGFGVYQPFDRTVFRPGQPVLIYGEVRNFRTELSPVGQYYTALRSTIEILRNGPDGELVERKQFDPTEDTSRAPRTDYFHSYKLDLPGQLTPGPHTLRLTLEDQLSGKIVSATVSFLVR